MSPSPDPRAILLAAAGEHARIGKRSDSTSTAAQQMLLSEICQACDPHSWTDDTDMSDAQMCELICTALSAFIEHTTHCPPVATALDQLRRDLTATHDGPQRRGGDQAITTSPAVLTLWVTTGAGR